MALHLIAALSWPGRVIGSQGALPWRLPEDLQRFKRLTMGHPMVMGRKTWDSLGGRVLPGRSHVVLAREPALLPSRPQVRAAASLEEALRLAASCEGGEEIFVIGGAQVYAQALPLAGHLHLTLLHHAFAGDAYFPPLDLADWWERSREPRRHQGEPAFDYEFLDLQRP